MSSLPDVFRNPESRVVKVIVAVDLANSTAMKEQQAEAAWLTTYGWFFDLLRSSIDQYHGEVIKYLGDGAMAVFSEDHPADAINWTINVQEAFGDAQEKNTIDRSCDCSVGIAYGEVVEFDVYDTSDGAKDYIGTIVDKAFRLSSAANAKAIFVDTDTCAAAAMNKVESRLGKNTTPKRKVADYQGLEESVTLKGFSRPVSYHEIFWGKTTYGVSPPFVTKLSSQQVGISEQSDVAKPEPKSQGWMRGIVQSKYEKFGFVRAEAEDFWFNQGCLFRSDLSVRVNDAVLFIPADPLPDSKNRRALDVIALGATLDGILEKVTPQGFGFAACKNSNGHQKQVFVYFGDSAGWSAGMEIEFMVSENRRGIIGISPKRK